MNTRDKIQKLFVIFSISNVLFLCAHRQEENNEQAMKFVKLVQKRYYLVHRLEKPVSFVVELSRAASKKSILAVWKLTHDDLKNTVIVPHGISKHFKHPLVAKYMAAMENQQNVHAIDDLWSDFLSYKYIDDELFVRETIVAIVMVYKIVAVSLSSQRNNNVSAVPDGQQEIYDNFNSILTLLDEPYDKEDFVITNNLRHYHIQRLLKSIAILTKIDKDYLAPLWDCLTQTINKNSISFKHEAVQNCLNAILRTQSLEPLFGLWRDFTAYKFANDSLFLNEFVTLEYMLYRKLIDCLHIITLKSVPTAEDLIELYASIATLPIPQMLDSLDSLVEELIAILEKYELNGAMSWGQWIKKYWWVPPVIAVSVIINFLLKRREQKIV